MIARNVKRLILLTVAALGLGLSAPLAAEPPVIGMIEWLDIDAYCAFLPADEEYAYDADGGWQYVFMTDTSGDERGYMVIDGAERDLILDRKFYRSDFEMRQYKIEGTQYEVRVFMVPDTVGDDSASYTGAITVSNGQSATAVAFHGDC